MPRRPWLIALWLALVAGALAFWVAAGGSLTRQLAQATSASLVAGGCLYLGLGCVRGFTLIPATALLLPTIAFFPPGPLFALTLLGIIVSSASVYWFAESWGLDEVLARRYPVRILALRSALARYELPVIVGWSFFPFAPTDLICYVCGVLRVSLVKCLIGVAIGEGAICGVYIFLGDQAMKWIGWRL